LNASNKFVSRYSSLLSIVFAAMLGRPENAADCSRANAVVTRLYAPPLKEHTTARCDVQSRLPQGDLPAVDFETMYRPMPANRIRVTHRTVSARDRIAPYGDVRHRVV
jgi:hypothetical protein